jgi:hypothetical protein
VFNMVRFIAVFIVRKRGKNKKASNNRPFG